MSCTRQFRNTQGGDSKLSLAISRQQRRCLCVFNARVRILLDGDYSKCLEEESPLEPVASSELSSVTLKQVKAEMQSKGLLLLSLL